MSARHATARATSTAQHPGGGRRDLVGQFATGWRFWAWAPADVRAVVLLGDSAVGTDAMLAAVGRPTFPPGVCTGCGCTDHDACPDPVTGWCHWIDRRRTRCSACGPAPQAPSATTRKAARTR